MKDARTLLLEYALLEQGYYKLMRKIKNTDQLMKWARENGIPKKARIVDWIRKKRLEALAQADVEDIKELREQMNSILDEERRELKNVTLMACGCSAKGNKAYLCDIHKKNLEPPLRQYTCCFCPLDEAPWFRTKEELKFHISNTHGAAV